MFENKEINTAGETGTKKESGLQSMPWIKRSRLVSTVIVLVLFAIGIIRALTGASGFVTTEINDQYLGVAGTHGNPVFLELSAITDVQLVDSFDFGTRIDGSETDDTVSGTYSCEQYGQYTAHAYVDDPCIILHGPNGVLVFNCNSPSNTRKMYDRLAEVVANNK